VILPRIWHPVAPYPFINRKPEHSSEKVRKVLGLLNFLPWTNLTGNQLCVEKNVTTRFLVLPDLEKAPLGVRLRYLRRSRGLTLEALAQSCGIGLNTLSRLERGETLFNPAIIGRILARFGPEAEKVFPKGQNPYDQLIPAGSFGDWLRNFRLRRGMRQKDLAEARGPQGHGLSLREKWP